MKRTALALAILAGTAAPALASNVLYCEMKDTHGNAITYTFIKPDATRIVETKFTKNGAEIPPATPFPQWMSGWDDKQFWLKPYANMDYVLWSGKLTKTASYPNIRVANAAVYRYVGNKPFLVSQGWCGTSGGIWKPSAQQQQQAMPTTPVYTPPAQTTAPAPASTSPDEVVEF